MTVPLHIQRTLYICCPLMLLALLKHSTMLDVLV